MKKYSFDFVVKTYHFRNQKFSIGSLTGIQDIRASPWYEQFLATNEQNENLLINVEFFVLKKLYPNL